MKQLLRKYLINNRINLLVTMAVQLLLRCYLRTFMSRIYWRKLRNLSADLSRIGSAGTSQRAAHLTRRTLQGLSFPILVEEKI